MAAVTVKSKGEGDGCDGAGVTRLQAMMIKIITIDMDILVYTRICFSS
jgi:hypothetical protein